MIRGVAETAMREIVGKNKMDFVLYEARKDRTRAGQPMQPARSLSTGVIIVNVTCRACSRRSRCRQRSTTPSRPVRIASARRMKARPMPTTSFRRRVARSTPDAGAGSVPGPRDRNAQGDAARFRQVLAEYQKAPAVTRDRIYLETMQQIYSTTKVMVDARSGSNLITLPLDKLMQQSAANERQQCPQCGSAAAGARRRRRHRLRRAGVDGRCATPARPRPRLPLIGGRHESYRIAFGSFLLIPSGCCPACSWSISGNSPSCSSWARSRKSSRSRPHLKLPPPFQNVPSSITGSRRWIRRTRPLITAEKKSLLIDGS